MGIKLIEEEMALFWQTYNYVSLSFCLVIDLLLIPLVVGVSSALFVGVVIIAMVTCCFMNRLARQRSKIRR